MDRLIIMAWVIKTKSVDEVCTLAGHVCSVHAYFRALEVCGSLVC